MSSTSSTILSTLLRERILVLDGAMGTAIQSYALDEAAFRGGRFADHPCDLQGNNDILSLTRPEIIEAIHRGHLDAGADIISTNTFNGNHYSQADYRTSDLVYDMNHAAAQIARRAADKVSEANPGRPRFVAGVLGPTSRTCSISPDVDDPGFRTTTFDELSRAYAEQARALIDGGVDILLIETIFDTLNAKAAIFAVQQVCSSSPREIPLWISGTITDASGRTLSGQTTEAFYISINHAAPWCVGLNCALGIEDLRPYVERLGRIAETPVSVHPNAGLPNMFGEYDDTPEHMAAILGDMAREGLMNIVGGCCGTTAEHIRAIAKAVKNAPPRPIPPERRRSCFSGLEPLILDDEALFVNVGERTNVAGSAKFARLIKESRYEEALAVARQQVQSGAQVIDVNMDDAMLDAKAAMHKFLNLVASDPEIARVPVMIDSSDWEVIEAGLKCLQGKGIVNSISLKDGVEEFKRRARLIRQYGAAAIVMAFDETGQADTAERKIEICTRAYRILIDDIGFPPQDIIFDPNILAIGTGIEEHDNYAVAFITACRAIKQDLPHALVSGGVSNLSFAFRGNNTIREAMHAVFLYHAIQAGMDMGIVNAGQLTVYDEIPQALLEVVEDIVLNRRRDATSRLVAFAETTKGTKRKKDAADLSWREKPIAERLSHALVNGITDYIDVDIEEARRHFAEPLSIVEGPLMAGMDIVGDRFASGKMFLPQVIKSARVMKKAVAILVPYIEAGKGADPKSNGKILLATVRGDVHDIGKNIVGVVLGCNNYEIIDLGVMVPAEKICAMAREENVDLIGLSGLITPSLNEMIHVARELERLNFDVPLLIGGATASPAHTAVKIEPEYGAPTVYVQDASRSVGVVKNLLAKEGREAYISEVRERHAEARRKYEDRMAAVTLLPLAEARRRRTPIVWDGYQPPRPRAAGITVFDDYPLAELVSRIDWTPFFMAWELRGRYPRILDDEKVGGRARELFEHATSLLQRICDEKILRAKAVLGLFPAREVGDDIEVLTENRTSVRAVIHGLRRQAERQSGQPQACLSDYIAPAETEIEDFVGAFVVSAGFGADDFAAEFKRQNDDYSSIMVKALADRLTEAFAERLHERVRTEFWGYSPTEQLSNEDLIKQKYVGIRPAPGYPACPDHTEKEILFELLAADTSIGVQLTANFAMHPAASVSGWYFSHPESRYFNVGPIGRDQVLDYAERKRMTVPEIERWLAAHLAYPRGTDDDAGNMGVGLRPSRSAEGSTLDVRD